MRGGLIVAFAAALASSLGACRSKPREAARVDGPITAMVREVDDDPLGISTGESERWDRKHVRLGHYEPYWAAHRCELVVSKPKVMTGDLSLRSVDCFGQAFELAADAKGERLAVRSLHAGAGYRVFYFGGDGRSFETDPARDRTPPIDWSAVPTLDAILEPMFEEARSSVIVDEVRARRGDAGLTDFLIKTAIHYMQPIRDRGRLCASYEPAWRDAAATLPPDDARRVVAALSAANLDVECFARAAADAGVVRQRDGD